MISAPTKTRNHRPPRPAGDALALFQLEGPARDLHRVDGRDVVVLNVLAIEGRDGYPSGVYVEGIRDDDGRRIGMKMTLNNWHLLRDRIEQKLAKMEQRRHRRPAPGQVALPFQEE